MGIRRLLACLALAAAAPAAPAAEPAPLRVGTSGDYAPFSAAGPGGVDGFDVAVARAYAEERGRPLALVPFAWPELLRDLAADRFDVAMSGITVGPERSVAGRFTVPVLESGAVVLVREPSTLSNLDELDQRSVRLGVNAGGHLERVARARFPRATLIVVPENAGVLRALAGHGVDAAVTDTLEAPLWEGELEESRRLGPFTRDRKAYLVAPDEAELAADLDRWLLAREADGSLASLRRRYLPTADPRPTATPLASLVAAMDERLALMPLVAAAKRQAVRPIADPAREQRVIEAAGQAVLAAAARSGRRPPPDSAVRTFFREQIEVAKAVQLAAVRDPGFAPEQPLPDLDAGLRPALLRIGDRIAALLVALPEGQQRLPVQTACLEGLRARWLADDSKRALCAALVEVALAPRTPPAGPEPSPPPSPSPQQPAGEQPGERG